MNLPSAITIVATNSSTGRGVANAAFILTLKAARKNNYSVGPFFTDTDGVAQISRADCEKAISCAQRMFVMDYAGDLESCSPVAELSLHNPEAIQRMIQQLESAPEFWGSGFDNPTEIVTLLRSTNNTAFAPISIPLNEDALIQNPTVLVRMTEAKRFLTDLNSEPA